MAGICICSVNWPHRVQAAQELDAVSDERFNALKQEAGSLLEENDRLRKEAKTLNDALNKVQNLDQLKNHQAVILMLSLNSSGTSVLGSYQQLQKDLRLLQETADVLDKKEKLWEIQIEDLETQQRMLLIEQNKLEALLVSKNFIDADPQIKSLKNELASRRQNEANLKAQLQQAKDESPQGQAASIRKEISQLQIDIAQLKKEKEIEVKRINEIKDRNVSIFQNGQAQYNKKRKEKDALEQKVGNLGNQIIDVKKLIDSFAGEQNRKRRLVNQMMALDKTYQSLREQVDSLNQKIAVLQAEAKDSGVPVLQNTH